MSAARHCAYARITSKPSLRWRTTDGRCSTLPSAGRSLRPAFAATSRHLRTSTGTALATTAECAAATKLESVTAASETQPGRKHEHCLPDRVRHHVHHPPVHHQQATLNQ